MPFRFTPEGRPAFPRRQRRPPTVPIVRDPDPEPVRVPTLPPQFESQFNRMVAAADDADRSGQLQDAYGQNMRASLDEHRLQQKYARAQQRKAQEAEQAGDVSRMKSVAEGFAPSVDDLDAGVRQAAAFGSAFQNKPYYQILEENRLHEGSRRAIAFKQSMDNLSPDQQLGFREMAVGLQKEGMDPATYERILESVLKGENLPSDTTPAMLEAANRVYRATEGEDLKSPPMIGPQDPETLSVEADLRRPAGLDPVSMDPTRAYTEELTRIRRDNAAALVERYGSLHAVPDEEYDRLVVNLGKQPDETEPLSFGNVGKFVANLFLGPGPEALSRVRAGEPILGETPSEAFAIIPDEQKAVAGAVLETAGEAVNMFLGPDSLVGALTQPALEFEQQVFTPFTEPIVVGALNALGIPYAEAIARELATVIVPSSIIPLATGAKASRWARMFARGVQEGAINVLQENAVRELRGQPPLDPKAAALMYGLGFAGGAGLPELIPVLRGVPARVGAGAEAVGPPIRRAPPPSVPPARVAPPVPEAVPPIARAAPEDPPVAAAAPETPRGGIDAEAQRIVDNVEAGGVPAFVSDNLARVARGNGVNPTGKTPNQIIDELRRLSATGAPSARVAPEAPPAAAAAPDVQTQNMRVHRIANSIDDEVRTRAARDLSFSEEELQNLSRTALREEFGETDPLVSLFRGVRPGVEEGTEIGRFWTLNLDKARDYAGTGLRAGEQPGQVFHVRVPASEAVNPTVREAASARLQRSANLLEDTAQPAGSPWPATAAAPRPTTPVTREALPHGRANKELQRGATDIQAADPRSPNVIIGRLDRIDWARRRATIVDARGKSMERRLESLEFFREGPAVAPPVARAIEDVPVVSRADVEVADDIVYSVQEPIAARDIVAGTRAPDRNVWAWKTKEAVAVLDDPEAVILTLRKRPGSTSIREGAPAGRGAAEYRSGDLTPVSQTRGPDWEAARVAEAPAAPKPKRLEARLQRAAESAKRRREVAEVKPSVKAERKAVSSETYEELLRTQGPLVQRMRNVVARVARVQPARAAEIAKGRRGQAARLEQAIQEVRRQGLSGVEAQKLEQAAMRGTLPKGEFDLPSEVFTPAERETLIRAAQDALENEGLIFEAAKIRKILEEKVYTGNLLDLQPAEVSLLGRVFGGDFALDVSHNLAIHKPSLIDELVAAIHFPRNILAGIFDQSGLLRQGGFVALSQNATWRKNAPGYYRAFFSEDFASRRAKQIVESPYTPFFEEHGLHLPLPGRGGAQVEEILIGREERTFIGRLLNHGSETLMEKAGVPLTLRKVLGRQFGTRAASDGMITFLSGLRHDTSVNLLRDILPRASRAQFDAAATDAARTTILREALPVDDVKAIVSFINSATGRGTLGPLNPVGRLLSLPFFAPRFVASQLTRFGPAFDPRISLTARKVVLRELGKYYGTVGTILGLVGLAGWKIEGSPVSVEWDPRSTDFGKIKIGPTRIDITSGGQPLFRYAVQLATGQRKSALGDIQELERTQAAQSLIRSKLSPAAGVTWAVMSGTTFIGEELSTMRLLHDLFTPIVFQDIEEATRQAGEWGTIFGALSFTGIGVVSYTSPSVRTKELIQNEFLQGTFDPRAYDDQDFPETIGDLTPEDKATLRTKYPEMVEELARATGETLEGLTGREARAVVGELSNIGREQTQAGIQTAADAYERSQGAPGSGQAFRDGVKAAFLRLRGGRTTIESFAEGQGLTQEERTGPVWNDLNTFFDIFDRHPDADFDPVERDDLFTEIEQFYGSIGPEREEAMAGSIGISYQDVPTYVQFREDTKAIREAGWFDIGDEVWEMTRAAVDRPLPASRREYTHELSDTLQGETRNYRAARMDADPVLSYYQRLKRHMNDQWLAQNTDLIEPLDRWDYRNVSPRSDIRFSGS